VVSADGRTVTLKVPDFTATRCYALSWQIPAADGSIVKGTLNGTLH
jgi:methionine-rich copper-binding protein CopC